MNQHVFKCRKKTGKGKKLKEYTFWFIFLGCEFDSTVDFSHFSPIPNLWKHFLNFCGYFSLLFINSHLCITSLLPPIPLHRHTHTHTPAPSDLNSHWRSAFESFTIKLISTLPPLCLHFCFHCLPPSIINYLLHIHHWKHIFQCFKKLL